ncbi:MAG: DUF1254 domain-containing protein [Nakamurella multipartita]
MSILASDLRTVSHEAYTYLYPLVTMEVTRRQLANIPPGTREGFGPPNQFHHLRTFPDADFRAVVRPNFDTLYSSAWLDLTRGPVIVEVPDSDDRYYMMPMLDMWTDVFANPGKRTTGTGAQTFVVTAPGYSGDLPAGATPIAAPTPHVWVIGRTQTNGPADYAAVNAFQDGLRITELAGPSTFVIDESVDTTTEPLRLVDAMSAAEFFTLAARTMAVNPPHRSDFSQMARMSLLGVAPGVDFDADRFDAAELAEIEAGAKAAQAALHAGVARLAVPVNGWAMLTDTMGVYGNEYFRRAVITLVGLGANPAQDAVYPLLVADADGKPTVGDHDYVIHFDADELPPAQAFWSITMYDAEGFQAPNELNRFAIGDRDPLVFNPDGSLDIYMQHGDPGPDRRANWLPAPTGPVGITMRLYAPAPAALDGTWHPPAVRRVS